jgi:hypothetical protein
MSENYQITKIIKSGRKEKNIPNQQKTTKWKEEVHTYQK